MINTQTNFTPRRKPKKRRRRGRTPRMLSFLLLFVVTLIIIVVGYSVYNNYKDDAMHVLYPKKYEKFVTKYCEQYEVDQYLIYAMIKQESNFEPDVVSIDKARGLMQLTEPTFDWVKGKLEDDDTITFDDMFDPETNIRYGVYLVSYLDKKFATDTIDNIVIAYHAGMNITSKWLANEEYSSDGKNLDAIPYKDTEFHLKKVKKYYKNYVSAYENTDKNS